MPTKVQQFDSFFGEKIEFKFTDLPPTKEIFLDMSFLIRDEKKSTCLIKYNTDESKLYEEIWEFTDDFKKIFPS